MNEMWQHRTTHGERLMRDSSGCWLKLQDWKDDWRVVGEMGGGAARRWLVENGYSA
jgi:hypothetical protein